MKIRVIPVRSMCRYKFPLLTAGGIIIGEEYCRLPANHPGPHMGSNGATAVNEETVMREIDPVTKRYY
jgi:hypothetical protein